MLTACHMPADGRSWSNVLRLTAQQVVVVAGEAVVGSTGHRADLVVEGCWAATVVVRAMEEVVAVKGQGRGEAWVAVWAEGVLVLEEHEEVGRLSLQAVRRREEHITMHVLHARLRYAPTCGLHHPAQLTLPPCLCTAATAPWHPPHKYTPAVREQAA